MRPEAISIHAAQEGCDCTSLATKRSWCYFNPRSPRGLRHLSSLALIILLLFQSTQPKRAATRLFLRVPLISIFQSTQPKRAATLASFTASRTLRHFNPRSPRGLRQNIVYETQPIYAISIHAAQEGCDSAYTLQRLVDADFNPRSPRGLRHTYC